MPPPNGAAPWRRSRERATPKILSPAAIAQYERDGFYHPLSALDAGQVARCRRDVERVERENLDAIGGAFRHKPHLLLTSLDAEVRNETILDAVEDLIGPDILVWASLFFTKEPGDPGYVGWHQDSTYWGLSGPEVVTAWLALSPATVASGAMRMLPGSHLQGQISHRETYNKRSLLTRGQEVEADIDEDKAVNILLEPGEFSLHHIRVIHGSGPNRGDDRRMGFTIRYIPTHLHQIHGRDRALLVRGTDEYGHFDHETPPDADHSEQAIAHYIAANESHNAILYKGAAKEGI